VVFDQQTLEQALDGYNSASPADRKSLEPAIFQNIIAFRKSAKRMDADERARLERRIAGYNNALVAKRR